MKKYIIKRLIENTIVVAICAAYFCYDHSNRGLIIYIVLLIAWHVPEIVSVYRWHKEKGDER